MREQNKEAQKGLTINTSTNTHENNTVIKNGVVDNKFGDDSFVNIDITEEEAEQNKKASKEVIARKNVLAQMPAYADKEFSRNPDLAQKDPTLETKKLGSKVRFKLTDEDSVNNARIDRAKELTQKATGYTLQIHETLGEVRQRLQ